MSWSFSPYILWFQVLSNYLIHFKLIFCEWYKISYPVFLQHFFWRDYSFPLEYSWLPCQIFAYHICGVYLLAIHYGSLVQEFICQHIYYFDYYRFLIWFETWELWFLQLCSFSGLFCGFTGDFLSPIYNFSLKITHKNIWIKIFNLLYFGKRYKKMLCW